MSRVCQSCGMSMDKIEDFGTNADKSLNDDYCVFCFKEGSFTNHFTIEEMVENNLKYLEEYNKENGTQYNEDEARENLTAFLHMLKRWRN